MNPYEVLKKPIISEKSNDVRDAGYYTFEVDKRASKSDVKNAVSKVFGKDVTTVRTLLRRGKFKRRGMYYNLSPQLSKRAIFKLAAGQKIEIFEDEK